MCNEKTTCFQTGKRRYTTKGAALRFMRTIKESFSRWLGGTRKKRGRKKPNQKRVYYCAFCKGYHLTSHEKTWRKKYLAFKKLKDRMETELKLIRVKDNKAKPKTFESE